jgi:hypothetical protein
MAIALINTKAHPAAVPYFTRFPKEPIPKASGEFVTVEKTASLADWQLTTLLDAMIKNIKAATDVLIVMHGNDAGLFIKVGPNVGFNVAVMRMLVSALEGRTSDADMLGYLNLNPRTGADEWKRLKDRILKMQALGIRRVDLRACNVGKDADVMYYLQKIFNCDICCAPKAYDVYGMVDLGRPTKDPRVWADWLKNHQGANVQSSKSGRFAYLHTIAGDSIKIEAMTDSDDAAAEWVGRNLPPGNYSSGTIYYHGLTPDRRALVLAGDARYRDYLVESAKGAAPPKVDVNAPLAR